VEDIAEALDLTPQAVYYRLRNNGPTRRGRTREARSSERKSENALTIERMFDRVDSLLPRDRTRSRCPRQTHTAT
jgi:hypothetical protein